MSDALASMTGYARVAGRDATTNFTCELRSVNGRGLDLRLRLPPGFDSLDPEFRRRLTDALARGSVTAILDVERDDSGTEIMVNARALEVVVAALDALGHRIEAQAPRLDGILALPGVLIERRHAPDAAEEQTLHAAILSAFDHCIESLIAARRAEGERLGALVTARLDEIAALTRAADVHPSRGRQTIQARLKAQIEDLRDAGAGVSEERLAQEAMLLAAKADIREELDRLVAHVAACRALLADGGAVGRRLDFLTQELNREANTLCAKSNAVELTAIGLDLKTVIDQLREQIQNIE